MEKLFVQYQRENYGDDPGDRGQNSFDKVHGKFDSLKLSKHPTLSIVQSVDNKE